MLAILKFPPRNTLMYEQNVQCLNTICYQ